MKLWIKILAGVVSGGAAVLLLLLIFCRRRRRRQQIIIASSQTAPLPQTTPAATSGFHASMAKLQRSLKSHSRRASSMFFQYHNNHQQSLDEKPLQFRWTDHPELVNDAVETGWSRFMFTHQPVVSSSSKNAVPRWILWSVCDGGVPRDAVETDWQVPLGSPEFMQTIRINPVGTQSSGADENIYSVRMCLPLPGPALGVSSFPQDSYFEVTILYLKMLPLPSRISSKRSKVNYSSGEGDKVKLIEGERRANASVRDLAIDVLSDAGSPREEGNGLKEEMKKGTMSIGLTVGGSLPSKSFVGSYQGSIGFHSNGSVYLDGIKLGSESKKTEWVEVNKVIGCGFEPNKRKVYFTVDSQLVHSVTCKSDVYKAPLYPVMAANCDVLLQVNLGQGKFRYQPANLRRVPNPCFLRSTSTASDQSSGMSCDSRELFSVGRMSQNGKTSSAKYFDADTDAESELFEIPLQV